MGEEMKRYQTAHERIIPLLVEVVGAKSYLELGTYEGETIGRVKCENRYGVDSVFACISRGGYRHFNMTTRRFIEEIASSHAPFDFVFIDADHSAEAVQSDFEGIWPFVSDDGIVCLHDTNPETVGDTAPGFCGDSWKFAKKLKRMWGFESVTLPYHPGLTIIRKRVVWGPAEEL